MPDDINCIDAQGRRQGWWIAYKVHYNPKRIPDELDSGNYVDHYTFGEYQNNKKTGAWKKIENVHQVYIRRVDSFYYSGDTARVVSNYMDGGFVSSRVEYIKDSSIINSVTYNEKDTVYINCKKKKDCTMSHQRKIFKRFPYDLFETNFSTALDQIQFSNDNWQYKKSQNQKK
jgi:hypothetical protein